MNECMHAWMTARMGDRRDGQIDDWINVQKRKGTKHEWMNE